MFKMLDIDGNGTIDFDEFKAGVKREPLLVQAFLAPVQQGSLVTAPAARRRASAASSQNNDRDSSSTSLNDVGDVLNAQTESSTGGDDLVHAGERAFDIKEEDNVDGASEATQVPIAQKR